MSLVYKSKWSVYSAEMEKHATHCEIFGSYLQYHHQHHVFRALFYADLYSQAQPIKRKNRLTGRQWSVVVRLMPMPCMSCLGDIP